MNPERRSWRRLLAALAITCAQAFGSTARAQASDSAQLERRLEQSLKMIESLASRVDACP